MSNSPSDFSASRDQTLSHDPWVGHVKKPFDFAGHCQQVMRLLAPFFQIHHVSYPSCGFKIQAFYTPWASTTIKIMVDPIPMIKTLRVQQWWLYENIHCFNGGWNLRVLV